MRRFFAFGQRQDESSQDIASNTAKHRGRNTQAIQSPGASSGKDRQSISISPLVLSAATTLSEAIDEILCDTNSLTGDNISGFLRLLDLFLASTACPDLVSISRSRGLGCLQILLDHIKHPHFVSTCNQVNLATSLMHSLRILRMYEIRLGKDELQRRQPSLDAMSMQTKGVTLVASERACIIFRTLCTESQTIEKLRPSLLKFITFPMFPFPRAAVHLQDHSASVVNVMCTTGFNSQQIWYLHDQQIVAHMIRSLVDLTGLNPSVSNSSNTGSISPAPNRNSHSNASVDSVQQSTRASFGSSNSSSNAGALSSPASSAPIGDCLLRGLDAEKAGLWLTAITCLINVICASVGTGTVLVSDFEIAGGHRLLTAVLENTSNDRLLMSINVVVRLLFDRQKGLDEPIAFPNAAGILYDLLLKSLGLERGIDLDDGIDKIVSLGHILYENRERLIENQSVIQNIAYALLTLYSNDPRNCNILEERYHFLPSLVIGIPALSSHDSISAVLTALNYVCQCIDSASTLPILSLCAAATVIVFTTLHCSETDREVATIRLDAVYSSIDVMIRSHAKFSVALVKCGMLEHLICGPIEQLRSSIWQGLPLDSFLIPIYSRLLQIIVAINRRNAFVADEIRRCGLQVMIRDLIKSSAISASFTGELLVLLEDLAKRDTSHLEEAIQSFVDLLRHTRSDHLKMARILDSLSIVLLTVEEAAHVWASVNGFSSILEVLGSLDGTFLLHGEMRTPETLSPSASRVDILSPTSGEFESANNLRYISPLLKSSDSVLDHAFECLTRCIRCMSADTCTTTGLHKSDPNFDEKLKTFRSNSRSFAKAMRNTGIFSSGSPFSASCMEKMFWLINGRASRPVIVNPHSVIAIVDLLPYVGEELAFQAFDLLHQHIGARIDGAQQMCQAGLVRMLLESFAALVHGKNFAFREALVDLVRRLLSSYLLLEDFVCLLGMFVRTDVLIDTSNNKLLPPWKSCDSRLQQRMWESVDIIKFLAVDCVSELNAIPYVTLGTKVSIVAEQSAYVSAFLSEASGVIFPLNAFSFSAWVQVLPKGNTSETQTGSESRGAQVIPLLALSSFNAGGCFLEIQFDVMRCLVRIIVRKGKKICTICYKPPFAIDSHSWQLIVVTVRRTKRFGSMKSSIVVYFNGLVGTTVNTEGIEFDIPVMATGGTVGSVPVEMAVGRHAMEMAPLTSDSAVGDDVLLADFRLPELWRLGPCLLFDEVLVHNQVSAIFMRGPTYTGTFQATSPLTSSLSNMSCNILRQCNSTNLVVEQYLDFLGFKGLEMVVEPKIEGSLCPSNNHFDAPTLPQPLLSFNAKNIIGVQLNTTLSSASSAAASHRTADAFDSSRQSVGAGDKCIDVNEPWCHMRVSLLNVAASSTNSGPEGSLMHGQFFFASESVASCVSAYGGPQILFPILQAASSGAQITSFFKILKACISMNAVNLKYMQTVGYKICAYILSMKPKSLITIATVEAIFELVVDRKSGNVDSQATIPAGSVLFVDTTAFYYLIMNTQVWDFSVSETAIRILKLILVLCNDEVYGTLNKKRLSSAGIVKWVLFLTVFGADQCCRNSLAMDPLCGDGWSIAVFSSRIIADAEDSPDEFLGLCVGVLEQVMTVELRRKDLDQIANSILHTLIPYYSLAHPIPSHPENFNGSSTSASSEMTSETILSAMCTTRIYLFRYLLLILERCAQAVSAPLSSPSTSSTPSAQRRKRKFEYPTSTEGSVLAIFRSAFSTEWFLIVLDKILDGATWCYYLRLLVSMIEFMPGFQAEFCAQDGIRLIGKQLQSCSVQEISAITPLLALLFRIPVALVPFKIHHSVDMLVVLEHEDCQGPDMFEPSLSSTTIPLLGLVYDCMCSTSKASSTIFGSSQQLITETIISMTSRAYRQNVDFRNLLQQRDSIEIIAASLLACSNAVSDYGSRIYPNNSHSLVVDADDLVQDISSLLLDDYIDPTGEIRYESTISARSHSDIGGIDSLRLNRIVEESDEKVNLQISGEAGKYFVDTISSIITAAITEFDHANTLAIFMLSFPRNLVESYIAPFHLFLMKLTKDVIRNNLAKESSLQHIQAISNILTSLVPLARTRVINDFVLLDLLGQSIELFKHVTELTATRPSSVLDKLTPVVKDVGMTCRFFALSCIQGVLVDRKNAEELRLELINAVRRHMNHLMMNFISDDLVDFNSLPISRLRKDPNDVGDRPGTNPNSAVFDALQLSWSSSESPQLQSSGSVAFGSAGRKVLSSSAADVAQLALAQPEKQKLSQLFCIAIIYYCCGLVFDDNISIRLEAIRLLALLAINRRSLIEQLINSASSLGRNNILKMAFETSSSNDETLKQARMTSLFMEGLDKLVPNEPNAYLAFLRNDNEDSDKEEHRVADFSYWFADNSARCVRILQPIEAYLQSISPLANDVDETVRQIQIWRAKEDAKSESASSVLAVMKRAEEGQRLGEHITNLVRKWRAHGLLYLSMGAAAWWKTWHSLQSSTLWGSHPKKLMPIDHHGPGRKSSNTSTEVTSASEMSLIDPYVAIQDTENGNENSLFYLLMSSQGARSNHMWRLNFTEGPERARRRLEQDFSIQDAALQATEAASRTLNQAEQKSMESKDELPIEAPVTYSAVDVSLTSARLFARVDDVAPGDSYRKTVSSTPGLDEISDEEFEQPSSNMSSPSRPTHDMSDATASRSSDSVSTPTGIDSRRTRRKSSMESFLEDFAKQGLLQLHQALPSSAAKAQQECYDLESNDLVLEDSLDETDQLTKTGINTENSRLLENENGSESNITADYQSEAKMITDPAVDLEDATCSEVGEIIDCESDIKVEEVPTSDDAAACSASIVSDEYSRSTLEYPISQEGNDYAVESIPSPIKSPVDIDVPTSNRVTTTPVQSRFTDVSVGHRSEFIDRRGAAQRRLTIQSAKRHMSAVEIVKGLVGTQEYASAKIYNVERILGLETQCALLLITTTSVHLLNAFRCRPLSQKSSSITNTSTAEKSIEFMGSGFSTATAGRQHQPPPSVAGAGQNKSSAINALGFVGRDMAEEQQWVNEIWEDLLSNDFGYNRLNLQEIYTIFRRRHQLKSCALEITNVQGSSLLFAFPTVEECKEVLLSLLETELPASIYARVTGMRQLELMRGLTSMYSRLMGQFLSTLTRKWQHGEITNFEYLIHLNSAAGRSFHDLTQYPVFPWVLADYKSATLDLNDPKSFRDLSRPMGALGNRRARQYRDRFKTMDEFKRSGVEGTPPPFHYGTHYSCAGYVLNYLIRLQPYSNMAIVLQGGHIDKADRLFSSIEHCWNSASNDNLQDVRELIPEFFYLPEFLTNSNRFGFGTTQKGEKVDDVTLPPWACNSPHEFIRLHREALESKYVSEHLNDWIDLIFGNHRTVYFHLHHVTVNRAGYKQRGEAAEDAMNVFIHLTYDDAVDVDAIQDPVLRSATISQINNFGQTPARLFSKPHPKRMVPDILRKSNDVVMADSHAIAWHEHVSPPLCVVGATDVLRLNKNFFGQISQNIFQTDRGSPIGDVRLLSRERAATVPLKCVMVPPLFKKYVRIGGPAGSISFHLASTQSGRLFDQDRDNQAFENLHEKEITCVAFGSKGEIMVTGSEDTSVRLWNTEKLFSSGKIEHICNFSGHTGAILCVDICTEYQVVVSGSSDYSVCCWDILTGKLLHRLEDFEDPIVSVSINSISGNIAAISCTHLVLYTINGEALASIAYSAGLAGDTFIVTGRVVMAPSSADWQDGVVAVTGHDHGQIVLWRLKREAFCDSEHKFAPIAHDESTKLTSAHTSVASQKLRRKLVPHVLAKSHRAQITALRLCSHGSTSTSMRRDMIEKSYENAGSTELIVGDMDGYVSRWSALRLDQYQSNDLQQMVASNKALKARVDLSSPKEWEPGSRISNITRSATLLLGRNKSDSLASRSSLSLSPSTQSDASEFSSSEPNSPF